MAKKVSMLPHGIAGGSRMGQQPEIGAKRPSAGGPSGPACIGARQTEPRTPPAQPRGPRSPSTSSLDEGGGGACGGGPGLDNASSASSPIAAGAAAATRSLKVPDVAIPMQHSLLKRISAFQSKEELLAFVAKTHCLLDLINLVTCLYRLAKMSKEASRGRSSYLAELQRHPTFQLLLRSISSKFLQAHLNYLHSHHEGLKGVDGRCLANLTWALAKLDLSADDAALTTELALTVAPFVVRCIDSCSPQGLANMLWAYAKLPVAPPAVVSALVVKISDQLVAQAARGAAQHHGGGHGGGHGGPAFDAQALSNSIWALAHLKSRGMDVDAGRSPVMLRFTNELAAAAARALLRPHATLPPPAGAAPSSASSPPAALPRLPDSQRYLALVEREFSCQALVNIAWSFATLLGGGAGGQPAVAALFRLIHDESLTRLRCTAAVLGAGQALPYVGGGGFNEQALSNVVYAFDKVGGLSGELLAGVFEVAALRLRRGSMAHHPDPSTFKPQELCTLLKACHSGVAPPWVFLSSLLRLLAAHPTMADGWTAGERLELQRACQLFAAHQADAAAALSAASAAGRNMAASDFGAAVSAAQGLAHSLAAAGQLAADFAAAGGSSGPPSGGRMSLVGLGASPPSLSLMGDAQPRLSGGSSGALPSYAPGRPRSSSGTSGGTFTPRQQQQQGGAVAASPRMLGRGEQGMFRPPPPPASSRPDVAVPASSTFGQLPVSAALPGGGSLGDMQLFQQLLQAQQQQAALAGLLQQQQQQQQQQQVLVCPVCSATIMQRDALQHIEACLANRDAAASLEFLLRQQQQDAAVRWALQQQQQQEQERNQQQQSLVLARLQQLQAQQNLLAAAHQQQQAQQQEQQMQQMQAAGLLGAAAGSNNNNGDALALPPWMLDAGAARPPLRRVT